MVAIYSQFPYVDKSILSLINYFVWGVVVLFILIADKKILLSHYLKVMVLVGVGMFLFQITLFGIERIDKMSALSTLFLVPSIVYYVSFRIGKMDCDGKKIHLLVGAGLLMVVILAIQIDINMFKNFSSWMNTKIYLYDGNTHKNSIGQILAAGVIIDILYLDVKTKLQRFVQLLIATFFIVALLYVQSRSAMIGLLVVGVSTIVLQKNNKRKIFLMICILLAVFFVANMDFVKEIFNQALLLNKYSSGGKLNLNTFSSGRLEYWKDAWRVFLSSPIVGVGYYYVDNFYLNCLASGGIVGAVLYLGLIITRFVENYSLSRKKEKTLSKEKRLLWSLTIFYICISFFEAYPPFGPGVATIFLWMFTGYIDGVDKNTSNFDNYKYRMVE